MEFHIRFEGFIYAYLLPIRFYAFIYVEVLFLKKGSEQRSIFENLFYV